MAHNLFSFNLYSGVRVGIPLVIGQYDMMKRVVRPPHIACGDSFIQVNRAWQPTLREGKLFEADLKSITPEGRRSFEVLDARNPRSNSLYLFVDPVVQGPGVRARVTPDMVNAISQVEVSEGVRQVLHDARTGSAFLEFHKEGGIAFVWTPDGMIYRLVRDRDFIVHRPLSFVEMAEMRTGQFREQIKPLELESVEHLRRYHGIIAGAVRLLRYTRDPAAQEVLVGFLVDQIGPKLTDNLRSEIRQLLLEMHHDEACAFLPADYVQSNDKRCCSRRKPTDRKQARSEHDRQERLKMRGPSGGGKQPSSPKKRA